jgi:lysophospholipase L1-like esterase
MVVGDSTALYVGQGLAEWSLAHPEAAQVNVTWCQGCTFMVEPEITTFDIADLVENSRDVVLERMPQVMRALQPDIVVLMVTVNDVANRQWSDEEGPLTPFDPRYVQRMTDAYAHVTMSVLAEGAPHVAWIVPPRPNHLWLEPDMNEQERYPVQHQVIRDVTAMFDQRVSAVDLDQWLTAAGHTDDPWWRADGVHLTDESAAALAEQYLGPLLIDTALQRA